MKAKERGKHNATTSICTDNQEKIKRPSVCKRPKMNNNNKQRFIAPLDESIQLVTDDLSVQIDKKRFDMLTRKTLNEYRLMRWCAFVLALSTLIIIWRYITILILSIWLSSICRPILEWLVNHL